MNNLDIPPSASPAPALSPWFAIKGDYQLHLQRIGQSVLIALAIRVGFALHHFNPTAASDVGAYGDWAILLLLSLLLFEVRIPDLQLSRQNVLTIFVSVLMNFVITPILAYGIASLFFDSGSLLFIGLVIYFIAPCTDWFLGFTRLAGGNTNVGSALIPLNMAIQLLLYPYAMYAIGHEVLPVNVDYISSTILDWFIMPLLVAIAVKLVMRFVIRETVAEHFRTLVSWSIPFVIAALIFFIFASNMAVLFAQSGHILLIGLAIFSFFVISFIVTELLSKGFKLNHGNHVLLSMTTTARNAPLMLAVTAVAFPDQPQIYAALILGMLIEFPHLTALSVILNKADEEKA
ncbi:MAG TPA: sodium:proton symporter [Rhizobiales bacterium]|nr:sodium:proton symporter [Hyphomicrobiales bacterium]